MQQFQNVREIFAILGVLHKDGELIAQLGKDRLVRLDNRELLQVHLDGIAQLIRSLASESRHDFQIFLGESFPSFLADRGTFGTFLIRDGFPGNLFHREVFGGDLLIIADNRGGSIANSTSHHFQQKLQFFTTLFQNGDDVVFVRHGNILQFHGRTLIAHLVLLETELHFNEGNGGNSSGCVHFESVFLSVRDISLQGEFGILELAIPEPVGGLYGVAVCLSSPIRVLDSRKI